MNADQVVDKILAEADEQARQIKEQAEQKASSKQADFDDELAKFKAQTDRLADEAAQDKKARMLAAARMELSKQILNAKVEMINEVFNTAIDRINSLPDNEYKELMISLMVNAVETGDEQVLVSRNESRIDQAFVKDVNRKLVNGYKGNLSLSQDKADISGGFILKRGNIQVNVSTEVLVSQIRSEIETEIAKELFS